VPSAWSGRSFGDAREEDASSLVCASWQGSTKQSQPARSIALARVEGRNMAIQTPKTTPMGPIRVGLLLRRSRALCRDRRRSAPGDDRKGQRSGRCLDRCGYLCPPDRSFRGVFFAGRLRGMDASCVRRSRALPPRWGAGVVQLAQWFPKQGVTAPSGLRPPPPEASRLGEDRRRGCCPSVQRRGSGRTAGWPQT
jgi:hypothetical protein